MKTLFVFWHGLGDNVLATPVIKKYKESTGNHIGWCMLRRFLGSKFFDDFPYVDDVYGISDVWNDFKSFNQGVGAVKQEAEKIKKEHGYDKIVIVSHKSSNKHKIYRTADEMGVELQEHEIKTFYSYDPNKIKEHYNHIDIPNEYVFFHGKTGLAIKDLPVEYVKKYMKNNNIDLPIVSPDFSWDVRSIPIAFGVDVMRKAKHIVVADSVFYHFAHAYDMNIDLAYFKKGKGVWDKVHPLHSNKEKIIYSL